MVAINEGLKARYPRGATREVGPLHVGRCVLARRVHAHLRLHGLLFAPLGAGPAGTDGPKYAVSLSLDQQFGHHFSDRSYSPHSYSERWWERNNEASDENC